MTNTAASAPRLTVDQLSALRRFEAQCQTAEDVLELLRAGFVRPADDVSLGDQVVSVVRGKLPALVMTGAGRSALAKAGAALGVAS